MDKGDIPPSLHYMTFYTTQTIYFLKAYDQTNPDHVFISYSSIAPFFSSIYVIILLTPDIIYFYFISGPAKRETPHSYCWIVIKKWYFPHQISHFWTHFQISNLWSPFWATVVSLMTPHQCCWVPKKCPQIALKMPPSLFFKVYFCHLLCGFVPTTYFYL